MAHLQLYKSLFASREFDFVKFVVFLSMAGLALATILSYISGVKYHLRIRFLNDFNDSFLLKLVAKGIASQQRQPDVRLPVTMDILVKMFHALPVVHVNPHEVCMYRAVLIAGFYGLMQPGELTESQHVLLVQGVQLQMHQVVITLNSSKANKSSNPEVITLLAQEDSLCPIKLIWDNAKIRPHIAGPFFLRVDNSPLQYSHLTTIIHKLAQFLELPHQYFKPHGLRIGGATWLHLSRAPPWDIQQIGRWSSRAFQNILFCSV